jgi:hypothetical protein
VLRTVLQWQQMADDGSSVKQRCNGKTMQNKQTTTAKQTSKQTKRTGNTKDTHRKKENTRTDKRKHHKQAKKETSKQTHKRNDTQTDNATNKPSKQTHTHTNKNANARAKQRRKEKPTTQAAKKQNANDKFLSTWSNKNNCFSLRTFLVLSKNIPKLI